MNKPLTDKQWAKDNRINTEVIIFNNKHQLAKYSKRLEPILEPLELMRQ